jgi:hypothetical protein
MSTASAMDAAKVATAASTTEQARVAADRARDYHPPDGGVTGQPGLAVHGRKCQPCPRWPSWINPEVSAMIASKALAPGVRARYAGPMLMAGRSDQQKAPDGTPWLGSAFVRLEPGSLVIVEAWIEENEKTGQPPGWLVRILMAPQKAKVGISILIEDASLLQVVD